MIIPANLLVGLAYAVKFVLDAYFWIVVGSAIVSWVNADPWNPIVRFLRSATSPVYQRLRRMMPFLATGGIDLAPMLVLVALFLAEKVIVGSLLDYAYLLKMRY